MTLFLLISFLGACAIGLIVGWRGQPGEGWSRVVIIQMLGCAVAVGGVIVAAEAGSAAARSLGLLAIVAGCAGLCGGFIAARRLDEGAPPS